MRRQTGKIGMLFLALVIALGGLGVGFAAWTDTITLHGTINTADINWKVKNPSCWCQCPSLCGETAWALCSWSQQQPSAQLGEAEAGEVDEGDGGDGGDEMSVQCTDCGGVAPMCSGWCFSCPGGWGEYFKYKIGDALTLPLVAGQNTQIGTVSVSTSPDDIIVEYNVTAADWTLSLTHLYLGKSKPKNCAPGQFPYNSEKDPSVIISPTVHRYVVPKDDICKCCDRIYVAAHADVLYPCQNPQISTCPSCFVALSSMEIKSGGIDNIVNCPPPTPSPTPQPCTCMARADGKTVIVNLSSARAGCWGELTFYIQNNGSIPIRVRDIIIQAPDGVVVELLTTNVIGTQLHPSKSTLCKLGFRTTSTGSFTFNVTVDAVQWNLY